MISSNKASVVDRLAWILERLETTKSGSGRMLEAEPTYIGRAFGALEADDPVVHPKEWDKLGGSTVSTFVDIVDDRGASEQMSKTDVALFQARLKKPTERRHRFETSIRTVGLLEGRLVKDPPRTGAFWAGDQWVAVDDHHPSGRHTVPVIASESSADGGALPIFAWRIQLHSPRTAVPLLLPTDAEGVRAFLQDRSADRKDRRSALLHWVEGHHRRRPSDDGFSWVREHMRGKTSCDWNGWHAIVLPSIRDAERAGWRAA